MTSTDTSDNTAGDAKSAMKETTLLNNDQTNPKKDPNDEINLLAFDVLKHVPTPLFVLAADTLRIVMVNQAFKKVLRSSDLVDSQTSSNTDENLEGHELDEIGLEVLQDKIYVRFAWKMIMEALQQRPDPRIKFFKRSWSNELSTNEDEDTVKTVTVDVAFTARRKLTNGETPRSDCGAQPKRPCRHGKMFIKPISSGGKDYFSMTLISSYIPADGDKTPTKSNPTQISPDDFKFHPSMRADPVAEYLRSTIEDEARAGKAPRNMCNLSIQQKVVILKNSLLDTMELPVFCAWLDGSITLPNKAGLELAALTVPENDIGFVDDSWTSQFRVWDKDFTRQLDLADYPLARLCRLKQPLQHCVVGIVFRNGERRVYDVGGKGILDEKGEWMAGLCWLRDITDARRELAKVKEGESERFKMMCNHMPQLIWTTRPDGFHDWYSDRWYEYTGTSVTDTEGEGWQNPFHPDDLIEANKRWRHSLATGEPYSVEYRCKRYDGVYRWMLGRALALRDSDTGEIIRWFGTCTDIENQVEARAVARKIREQLQNVMSHAAITLWQVDTRKRITLLEGRDILSTDPKTSRFNRKEVKNVVGKHVEEVFLNKEFTSPIERILSGEKETFSECSINNKYWRTLYVPIIKEPSTGQDRGTSGEESDSTVLEGVIGVSMDITDKKNQEAELAVKAEENLRLMANEAAAKEASRLKSQFLANMSHEIRTPIAGVIGMSDILLDTDLNDEQKEYAENVQRSANALLTVINDILDFSKVESGRLDIEEVQFSLSLVISDVVKMLHFDAEKKHVQFLTQIHHPLCDDLQIMGDPGRCRQVLSNLLTNSIKFTSQGYIKLSAKIIEERRVEKDNKIHDLVVVYFEVEDTGIGITEEVRKRLFQPFGQADSSTARRFGGSGLGLAICKNLVELMGGTIDLTSEYRKGTKAFFQIPFRLPEPASPTSAMQMSLDVNSLPERLQNDCSVSCRGNDASNSPRMSPSPSLTPTRSASMSKEGAYSTRTSSTSSSASLGREYTAGTSTSRDSVPLPLELSPGPMFGQTADLKAALPQERRRDLHVLVVEDNPINQQIAIKVVKRLGFNVSAVWNGQEALDYLLEANIKAPNPAKEVAPKSKVLHSIAIQDQLEKKLEEDGADAEPILQPEDQAGAVKVIGKVIPDLILLDVQMPIKDGYETSKAIRLFPSPLREVPIVGLTASAIKGDREKCVEAGMNDYLAKPVRVLSLEKMLVKWLSAGPETHQHIKRVSPMTPPGDNTARKSALSLQDLPTGSSKRRSEPVSPIMAVERKDAVLVAPAEERVPLNEQLKLSEKMGLSHGSLNV